MTLQNSIDYMRARRAGVNLQEAAENEMVERVQAQEALMDQANQQVQANGAQIVAVLNRFIERIDANSPLAPQLEMARSLRSNAEELTKKQTEIKDQTKSLSQELTAQEEKKKVLLNQLKEVKEVVQARKYFNKQEYPTNYDQLQDAIFSFNHYAAGKREVNGT